MRAAWHAHWGGEAGDGHFMVWRRNWRALRLFLAGATQWHRAGMAGIPTGLDYAALEMVMRTWRVPLARRRTLFDRVRIMEGAALPILIDRMSKGS
ncbi:MAG: DUF1799 domain-containing protein [Alphaproteobacteria bacterium]